jgi:ABC-2 type transport system permease protein
MTMLRTEWLKLRTTRTPWLMLGVAQLLIVLGASGLLARGSTHEPDTVTGAVAHVGLLSLVPLMLGIMAVAGEYRHRTITDTYLGEPRRGRVVGAKLTAYTMAGLVFGLVGTVTALATTAVWFAAKGATPDLGTAAVARTVVGGILWNAAFAAIGVGLGALVRNLVGAIAGALAWLALIEGLVGRLIGASAARWLPFNAGTALDRLPNVAHPLPQWGAGLLLAGYAAVVVGAGLRVSVRGDVA